MLEKTVNLFQSDEDVILWIEKEVTYIKALHFFLNKQKLHCKQVRKT